MPPPADLPPESPAPITPAEPRLQRLTAAQYRNTIRDIFGAQIVLPTQLEPDRIANGLVAVGASIATISPWGVEQYERAAYDVAEQALASTASRSALVPCQPGKGFDRDCAQTALAALGVRIWRRPLSAEELTELVDITEHAASTLGDFHAGLQFSIAAMLQSPNFLFRVELGEADPDGAAGSRRYTNHEMAARLSYFLWNTTPDSELRDAAERGELVTDPGLRQQAERLIASPNVSGGIRNFFSELYELYELDELSKDAVLYTHYSPELGPAARDETLRGLEHVIVDQDADFRDIFTTRRTFVDRRLAAIYNVPASARDGFGEVALPQSGLRRGLFGQVSFLALQAHPVSSSASLRGAFIRQVILCGVIPPPPVDVNTALPEPTGMTLTLRDRVAEHLTNPQCRGCHLLMDPIGLGFENFDSIGRLRTSDNGVTIDATGDIDGKSFQGPEDLAQVVYDDPRVGRCLTRNLYRYATGNVETIGEQETLNQLSSRFERSGYRVKHLLLDIATSQGFRLAVEPTQ